MIIGGVGPAAPQPAARLRNPSGRFAMPSPADPAQATAASCPALPLDGMLALQEQAADATRDRQARQHGHALLRALAALQHATLTDGGEGAALQQLATLAASHPPAADPGLAAVIAAVALRAQVELARRGL